MHSTPSLRRFPSVGFEIVPVLVCLTITLLRSLKADRRALPLSTLLSFMRSVCNILGFAPQVVSQTQSSVLLILRGASHSWWLLCCHSICSVSSLNSSIFSTAQLQDYLRVDGTCQSGLPIPLSLIVYHIIYHIT